MWVSIDRELNTILPCQSVAPQILAVSPGHSAVIEAFFCLPQATDPPSPWTPPLAPRPAHTGPLLFVALSKTYAYSPLTIGTNPAPAQLARIPYTIFVPESVTSCSLLYNFFTIKHVR